ncbi:LysR family transcriptional regulator [Enterococcus sp. HY326]|uniref:LysR family transcriptional regulator n=1 Tax=Enterococcus sp. HY326 TaxID=2971265 RepID=UPI00223F0A4B|nr:LysR family transcriptional regulator [Enterococcus sp. HY326]
MHLRDLEYFHQLVIQKNFTKVATYFQVSQPTVTYAVKRLEEKYATQLIFRDQAHHAIQITTAGKILDGHIRTILEQLTLAELDINRLKKEKFEIGLPNIIGNYYFPKISVELFSQNLMEAINLNNGGSQDMYRLLKSGKLDAALIGSTQSILDEQLDIELLAEKRFMIVVSKNHPLAKQTSVSFSALKDEKFIMFNEHFVHLTGFKKLTKQAGFTPDIVYQTSDLNIIKGMLKEQVGISFLTEIAIQDTDELVTLAIDDYPQPTFMISLVLPHNPVHSPELVKILKLIRNYPY